MKKEWIIAGVCGLLVLGSCEIGSRITTSILENMEVLIEMKNEAAKTPEYRAYEEYAAFWNEPREYAMVYKLPLEAGFQGNNAGPSYEEGGILNIRTERVDMNIFFVPEGNGARILQSSYRDLTEEDPDRSEYLYVGNMWYSREDWQPLQSEPGFSVEEVDNYVNQAIYIGFPEAEALGSLTDAPEEEGRRYTFYYGEDYLKRKDRAIRWAGVPAGQSVSEYQSFLVSPSGIPLEQQHCVVRLERVMKNAVSYQTETTEWQTARYFTRDAGKAQELLERCLTEEPQVPQDALELFEAMSGGPDSGLPSA